MKQFNYELTNPEDVTVILKEVYSYTSGIKYESILFHLYSIIFDDDEIMQVQEGIREVFPDANICGNSTNGDICDGHLAEYGMVLAASVFDSTDAKVRLFPCTPGQETDIGKKICETIDGTEGIKAAEILITLKSINSHAVLDEVEKCREDVKIFGGGCAAMDIAETNTKVMDETHVCRDGVVLVTYVGDDLVVDVHHAIGWKPLGKDLTVTRIEGKTLYELDGIPAGKIYSRYLDIQADDSFFDNILEFPIMSIQHGYQVLRLPFSCNTDDNSIVLAADVQLGSTVNLSYGDPEVIRGDVKELEATVKSFAPQAIFLYSCGVRRLYWKYLINKETGGFSQIAPVCGFYSSGEIMRMGRNIIEHHVTLIAISMREGEKAQATPTGVGDVKLPMSDEQRIHGQISMVRRLATFINVTAAELRQANEELKQMADTDALTGLYNRRVLDNLVRASIDYVSRTGINVVLGIIDVDDFKMVNDTYGHSAGDKVLKTISAIIKERVEKNSAAICGRWGGEEFLFLLPNMTIEEAREVLESIRTEVSETDFGEVGNKTISVGMTQFNGREKADDIFDRADKALYEAKGIGKNTVVLA